MSLLAGAASAASGIRRARWVAPSGRVGSNLSGFVHRIDLATLPVGWWTPAASDGSNTRARVAGDYVPLDVVWFDRTNRRGEAFVRIPSIAAAADNVLDLFSIDTAATIGATDPLGRNAVWTGYDVVAGGAPGGTVINRCDGTAFTTVGTAPTITSDGWIDHGTGRNGHIYLPGVPQRSVYSIGVTVYNELDNPSSVNAWVLGYINQGGTSDTGRLGIGVRRSVDGETRMIWNSSDGYREMSAAPRAAVERWGFTLNGTSATTGYVNGSSAVTDNSVSARPTSTPADFVLGGPTRGNSGFSTAQRWQGRQRNPYLRNGLLTPDWVAAEDASWRADSLYDLVA